MNREYARTERPRSLTAMTAGGSSARLVKDSELSDAVRRRKNDESADLDSRYVEMLCERYRDRGIAGRVHADAARQQKQEALERARTPGAYVMTEKLYRNDGMKEYRSGESDGRRYMTVDDYDRFYHEQRNVKFPEFRTNGASAVRHDPAELLAESPAAAMEVLPPKKAGWLTDTDKLPAFLGKALEKPAFQKLNEWAGETFPRENSMVKANKKAHRVPAGLAAGLAVIAVSMSMVISGTVLVSQSTREVSELKDTLAAKEAVRSKLTDELDLKNDLLDIRSVAMDEMGMVGEQYLSGHYLDSQSKDYLEVYGEGNQTEPQSGWSAILSAFGLKRD